MMLMLNVNTLKMDWFTLPGFLEYGGLVVINFRIRPPNNYKIKVNFRQGQ